MTTIGGKDVDKGKHTSTVMRVHNHCGNWCGGSSQKLDIDLLYDSAKPLLGIFPKAFVSYYGYLVTHVHHCFSQERKAA